MKKQKEDHIIDQFFVTLSTTYQQIQENDENPSKHSGIKSKIEDMLQGTKSWHGLPDRTINSPSLEGRNAGN